MKLSDLISTLQAVQAKRGDLDVQVTCWLESIGGDPVIRVDAETVMLDQGYTEWGEDVTDVLRD